MPDLTNIKQVDMESSLKGTVFNLKLNPDIVYKYILTENSLVVSTESLSGLEVE